MTHHMGNVMLAPFFVFASVMTGVAFDIEAERKRALLLEIMAFCYLRVTLPDLERPFKIPLGTVGVLLLLALPTVICFTVSLPHPHHPHHPHPNPNPNPNPNLFRNPNPTAYPNHR